MLLFTVILSSCSPKVVEETATATPEGTLRPYLVARATVTVTLTSTPKATATPLPTATPTPITYKVGKDDDMFGVALRFGVSLAALKTANPTVNPRAMSVGTILIIPVTPIPPGAPSLIAPTPTPALITTWTPVCYPSGDGGLWCYLLVKNNQSTGLENLEGQIVLSTGDPASQVAIPVQSPLDILPAGEAFPLVAFFPNHPAGGFTVLGQITSMLPQPVDDGRYLPVSLDSQQTILANDLKSALVAGSISLGQGHPAAGQVWLLATAYARNGQVAGVRRWSALSQLVGGAKLTFNFTVYSQGPEIDHVILQTEARP